MIKGILFDMDGVVLDTEKLYTRFWQEAAQFYGYPMTKEQALGMRSLNRGVGEAKLKSYFGQSVDYEQVRNKRMELMDAFIEREGTPEIKNLLVAGRAISSDFAAQAAFRTTPCAGAIGHAAGAAAALAAENGDVTCLEYARIRELLLEQGAFLPPA